MAGWIRRRGGRLKYSGRITRRPFAAWVDTPEGQSAIDAAAAHVRFSLLGKRHAAQRRLWRDLSAAASEDVVAAAIQDEADSYLSRLAELAFGEGLPRVTLNLYRLVVVPRQLLNAVAYRGLSWRLHAEPAITSIDCDPLVHFFCQTLIHDMDRAAAGHRPSPRNPVGAGDGWMSVGLNDTFVWYEVGEDTRWPGHHFLFEVPREPMRRPLRKALEEAIANLDSWLLTLSRLERTEILRRASPLGRAPESRFVGRAPLRK